MTESWIFFVFSKKKTRKLGMELYLGFSFFIGFVASVSAFESRLTSSTDRWSSRFPTSMEGDGMQQPSSRQLFNVTAIAEQSVYLNPGKTAWKTKFEWRHENQLLPANHRQIIFPNGTLLIQKVDRALDVGLYSGPMVEYHLDIIQPPRIEPLVFPSDLSPLARVRVSCVVSKGDPPITIEWYKDNQRLTTASAALLDISLTNIDEFASFLAIPSLNVRHAATYTCMARNRVAQDAKTARLVVNVPVHWVHEPSSKAFALQNANLNMTCQANGNPKPVIEWKKALPGVSLGNYTPVANDRSHLFENGTLIMRDVQQSDEGLYLCQASNGIGPVISKVVHLTVKAPAYFLHEQETVAVTLGSAAALECHAYGELPITVYWFYKGKPLKEGSYDRLSFDVQNLSDSVKSTVRISRSQRTDSGVYSCKASNEFGSKTRKVEFLVQEVAEKAKSVNVVAINSRMGQIEWSAGYDGNSPVINFILEWKRQTDLWTHDGMKREHAPGNSTKYTLKNLHPATRYDIRVRAENALGQSEPSQTIQIVTDEEAPSLDVLWDVKLTSPTSTTINLTWKPPAPETHNGAIQGYVIEYKAANSSDNFVYKKIQSDGKREESVTLRDLRKFAPYMVVIQAYNTIGSGPKLDLATIWTQEDVPTDAPRLVTAVAESPQRISMTWEQLSLDSVNGVLLGYKVLYKPLADWTSQSNVKIVQDTSCALEDLRKFTNYTVQVLAFTKEGEGPTSTAVFAQTLPDVPSHPAEIKAWTTSPTSILVSWTEPKEKNGIIKNFNVYMRSLNGRKDKKRVVYPDEILNKFEFAGLVTDTQYELWVTAETDVGESGSSFVVKVTPKATGPARIASFSTTVSAPTGQSAILACTGVGYGDPVVVEWWQGSRMVMSTSENREILRNGSLRILKSQPSDSGVYSCRVRNIFGEDSVDVTLIIQRSPMAPNITVASVTDNTVVVNWKVLYDGGSTIKGYTLYYKSNDDSWKSIRLPANFQSYTLKNLLCGHSYTAYITAYNDIGTSEAGPSVSARIPGQVPVSSDLQSLIFPNTTSVIVFLSAWKDGGCPIRTFGIQYQAFHEKEWVRYGDQIPGNAESITIPDMEPQNGYRLKLRAVNDAGAAEREYVFGTLTENGDTMLPEVIMRKEQSVRPFHEDPPKISAVVGGIIFALLLVAAAALLVKRRRDQKYPASDRDLTNNRRLISHHLDYLTPRKSASSQSPWKTVNEFSDPNHSTPVSLGRIPQQWHPPICDNDFINLPPYGSPKRLNTTIRTNDISLHEIDPHYQTPRSARVIKRDDSTPDSGFSGSNLKHTDCEGTFQRQSAPRTSNGSVASDSDNLQKLNLNLHKNRPKPAPRRRPPTRSRHMGTSLLRARSGPPAASSSSPSSVEDIPQPSHTARFVRKHQPHIYFPSPPHSDDDGRRPLRLTHQEAYDLHRYSCELRPMDQYTYLEDGRQSLQPTTTV